MGGVGVNMTLIRWIFGVLACMYFDERLDEIKEAINKKRR